MKIRHTYVFTCLLVLLGIQGSAQQKPVTRPKLVVGIVVDQMRWDYLYRFQDRYGKDGFNRMLGEGFSCENTFIPYTPTYTAAGHACVYTGSVPALNGIMGNSWYDRSLKRSVYCTEDDSVQTVGSSSSAGKMSPKNMWSTTITDEVRMAQNFRNKTIALSLKDRGAILPGGHTSNQSYWFDNATGGWISSTFFMPELPAWVRTFNEKKLPDTYLKKNWNPLYPIETYRQSTADSKTYEGRLSGEDNTFPHLTESITNNKYESFRYTPYGNTYTLEFARAAIENEKLGKNHVTDFLAISLSSPDYIGHAFGPNSVEVEDAYLRLDRDMASFLKYLDVTIGKGQYLVFLTADHAVAHIPAFSREHKMPGGTLDDALIRRQVNDSIQKYFALTGAIEAVSNYQIYLNHEMLDGAKADLDALKQFIIRQVLKFPGVSAAYDLSRIRASSLTGQLEMMLVNGYNQKLSGDIQFVYRPQFFDGGATGTTHGSWNPYDSHIPLLWFGWKVKPGKLYREVYMTDIAPTLAAMLQVQMPNASIGKVIEEVIR